MLAGALPRSRRRVSRTSSRLRRRRSQPQPPAAQPPYKPEFEIPKRRPARRRRPASTEGYVIGPQDNLSIIVSDEAELTGKYRVDTDGTISMPYLSRVPLAGLSLAEAQVKIAAMLQAGFIRNPQVRIEVDQFKARSVLVTGEVRTPGKVTLPGSTMSLLEALALAGSPTAERQQRGHRHPPAEAGRAGARTDHDQPQDLELGQAGRDITLQDGDIVNVPVAQAVLHLRLRQESRLATCSTPGTTVSQAIVLAGGLTDRGIRSAHQGSAAS